MEPVTLLSPSESDGGETVGWRIVVSLTLFSSTVGRVNSNGMRAFRLMLLLLAAVPQRASAAPPDAGVKNTELARAADVVRIDLSRFHDDFLPKTVWFDRNKDTLKLVSFAVLDERVRELKAKPDIRSLRIEGHADNSESNGFDLSRRRAASVIVYLIEHGIEQKRLVMIGVGSGCPRVTNDTPGNRDENRRVEFVILEQQGVNVEPPRCRVPTDEAGMRRERPKGNKETRNPSN